MANALKKINARVKVLQKKHPGKKRTTLQKQAGREWKAGKLSKKRKPARRKVGSSGNTRTSTKAATSRNRTKTSTKTITARVNIGRTRKRRRKPVRRSVKRVGTVRRRVGKSKSNLLPIIAIGGLAVAAVLLLNKRSNNSTQYIPTGNPVRDSSANNILAWATAGGIAFSAIAQLIKALNEKSDAELQQQSANISAGGGLPPSWYGSV